ncbi:MAG: sensor histidine kinase, partial [Chloroflexota bacterium]
SQTLRIHTGLAGNIIVADRSRIVQVLTNLASNASKYSPSGSEIAIAVEEDGDNVAVSVTDRGYGVDPEDQEFLFTPFYRSPQAVHGSEPGTGLGLYIVKSIVEAHGGSVSIQSQKDVGTTVTFSVPARGERRPVGTCQTGASAP